MRFDERRRIIFQLEELEQKFPIGKWKINDIDLWPILKMKIFFMLFDNENAVGQAGPKRSFAARIILRGKRLIAAYSRLWTIRFAKVNVIFAGASSHRATWNGQSLNRYFDPIMDYCEDSAIQSYLFEHDRLSNRNIYKPDRVIELVTLLPAFQRRGNFYDGWRDLKEKEGFKEFLKLVENVFGIAEGALKQQLLSALKSISDWERLFTFILKRTQPSFVFGLCYYSNQMIGINLASFRMGIKTIDMQHGSQGELHPAYYYKKMPKAGYNILPSHFWCWDETSVETIRAWSLKSDHKTILGGNPWIKFLTDKENLNFDAFNVDKPIVLFTLQPLTPVIDPYMLDVINASCDSYSWWIRFHPRMTLDQREELNSKLDTYGIKEKINFKDANELPLPLICQHASAHISKYSGSILEAAMVGLRSIITDRIGASMFENLLHEGLAVECFEPDSSHLLAKLNILTSEREQSSSKKVVVDFVPGLREIFRCQIKI